MPYKDPEAARARSKRYYLLNKARINTANKAHHQANKSIANARSKAWRLANPKRAAYMMQLHRAKGRGIDFLFTFQEWMSWWGEDFEKRGITAQALQMCRYGDTGPYTPANVYKDTALSNNTGPHYKTVSPE